MLPVKATATIQSLLSCVGIVSGALEVSRLLALSSDGFDKPARSAFNFWKAGWFSK